MAIIKPPGDGGRLEARLDDAERLFSECIDTLFELRTKVKSGELPTERDVSSVAASMTKATQTLLNARSQLDEQRRTVAGLARDFAIDFSDARTKVRSLLDRLRDARDSGEVP